MVRVVVGLEVGSRTAVLRGGGRRLDCGRQAGSEEAAYREGEEEDTRRRKMVARGRWLRHAARRTTAEVACSA
jgi:hypothetical protein